MEMLTNFTLSSLQFVRRVVLGQSSSKQLLIQLNH